MKVVITIPAYNEEKTVGRVIADIKKVMKGYKYQIIVIDDGSKDKTRLIAEKYGAYVISHPLNYGLAETFRTEMKEALKKNPDIILHMDADGQYLASDIPRLLRPIIKKEADIVLGSRFLGKIESMPLVKRIGNIAFSKAISGITRTRISDCQTGFRAFTKKIAELTILSDHTYTQEQVIRAIRHKFRIIEVPIYFARRHGKSRLISSSLQYAIKAWINILRVYRDFRPLKFFGYSGAIFFIVGVLLGLWILYNIIITGSAGALPRVLLTVLLITVGIQIWLFGFLADMVKKE